MKKFQKSYKFEIGQIIPLVVLMILVIVFMVALILDGGAIMSNKRTSQAAADAGALAGVQRVCTGETDAKAVAEYYATALNGASYAEATVVGQTVRVNATVEHPSFFAKIFGEEFLKDSAGAEAVASCFYPSIADRILPIAFYYEGPPVNAVDAVCKEDGSCTLVASDFHELMQALSTTPVVNTITKEINLPLDDIYVISDKTKICEKDVTGEIVCSVMNGSDSGGNRSFLDLNDVLKNIIESGLDTPIHLPAWVNGEAGVNASVYNPANYITNYPPIVGYETLKARLYFLPVFDLYCKDCSCAPTADYDPVYCDQYNKPSYHLLGFGSFVVTCVQLNQDCVYGDCVPKGTWTLGGEKVILSKNRCPGLLATDPSRANPSESAIEGYFVLGFPADQYLWGTEGADVGVWLISLSK